METRKTTFGAKQIALTAMLTAIVAVLQLLGNYVQPIPGVSLSLVLVPIVLGAALLGPMAGAWLGFVFSVMVLVTGGATAFLPISAIGTVLTVLVKGTCAGYCAGLVFKALSKLNQYVAIICAAITAPVVNTGLFLIGCKLFFWPTIIEWGKGAGFENPVAYAFLGLAGINFLVELGINVILAPVILRLLWIGRVMSVVKVGSEKDSAN
ncbi:MAG: ECF transporter S component [Oscillospiraceae bacterium]|nr:ECF transporter S component [Oscillospiraceae bacterium]